MTERIAVVTGGGDCPGLNAVIRAVTKAAALRGWETIGFIGGYEGMLEPLNYRALDHVQMSGLLFRGGTILGTSNRGRFAAKTGHGEVRRVPEEILQEAKRNFDSARPARPGHDRRRRFADNRPAALRDRHSRRRRA